jgi:hypothetical protein
MDHRNYREEIETALAGGAPRHVPFTCYEGFIPKGEDYSQLFAGGLAPCKRCGVVKDTTPNVELKIVDLDAMTKRVYLKTPVGTVYKTVTKGAYDAYAPVDFYVKSKDDYKVAEFIVKDHRFEKDYENFVQQRDEMGDRGIVIGNTSYTPLLEIQLVWLGQEAFCYEIADNEDAVMSLYDLIWKRQEKEIFPIIADGPAQQVIYGGNLVPQMIGLDRIRRQEIPCWETAAGILHAKGKMLGMHLDADNLAIKDVLRDSPLDFFEAFTPPPDTNLSVATVRQEMPDKRLWVNFPSSVHLAQDSVIREATLEILRQAGDRKGFLMGITEDMPPQDQRRSLSTILNAIHEYEAA